MGEYLKRFFDVTDPTASLKHAAYALVVLSSCGWLTYGLVENGMDASWIGAYTVLIGAVTTAKIVRGNESATKPPDP